MRKNNRSSSEYELLIDFFIAGIAVLSAVMGILLFLFFDKWLLIILGYICISGLFVGFFMAFYSNISKKNKGNIERKTNIKNAIGNDFEWLCAEILRNNGFENVVLTKGSGDRGIDILASRYEMKYAFQCKKYSRPVGNKAVQEAYSGRDIYKADVAVVMTNSNFTKQAINDARDLQVELWDGYKLKMLIKSSGMDIDLDYMF